MLVRASSTLKTASSLASRSLLVLSAHMTAVVQSLWLSLLPHDCDRALPCFQALPQPALPLPCTGQHPLCHTTADICAIAKAEAQRADLWSVRVRLSSPFPAGLCPLCRLIGDQQDRGPALKAEFVQCIQVRLFASFAPLYGGLLNFLRFIV